jgi:hypothetical protein
MRPSFLHSRHPSCHRHRRMYVRQLSEDANRPSKLSTGEGWLANTDEVSGSVCLFFE